MNSLILHVRSGPPLDLEPLDPGRRNALGRHAEAAVLLADSSVSRHHAELCVHGSAWMLRDCGSAGGTFLNGMRLETGGDPVPVAERDLITVGPWTFEVDLTRSSASSARSVLHPPTLVDERVEQLDDLDRSQMARHQLQLLLDCAGATRDLDDEAALAATVVDAAVAGTGFERAALLRGSAEDRDIEVVASHCNDARENEQDISFSRTLVRHAARGETAMLSQETRIDTAASIVAMGISAALAIPVRLGEVVAMCLYLDVREVSSDAARADAVFCEALAGLAGLAFAGLRRRELEGRQARIDADLEAAREVQDWLVPGHAGAAAGPGPGAIEAIADVDCVCSVQPGAVVAGDFFDACPLPDGRVAFWIGDVTGEGIAAGLLMTATQAWLRADLERDSGTRDPAETVAAVNRFLCARSAPNRFVSLWLGLLDAGTGELLYVDAGHGHWVHRRQDGTVDPAPRPQSHVLGIDERASYVSVARSIGRGDRIVLYSDGLVEQADPQGDAFGLDRIRETVAAATSSADDVARLRAVLGQFADRDRYDDDVTIASVGR